MNDYAVPLTAALLICIILGLAWGVFERARARGEITGDDE